MDAHAKQSDADLLRQYVRLNSETAFRQLVERHLALVQAAARRQVRDPQLADDVTQAVFILLARKARGIADPQFLPAWLLKAAFYACRDARKLEARRKTHEREAAAMNALLQSPATSSLDSESDAAPLLPLLDSALARLRDTDRAVITLRFLHARSMTDVGAAVGISEAAAAKRVERVLEKLRAFFSRHGVTLSAAALPVVLASALAPSASAAPTALAAQVSSAALSAATATAATTTSLTLAKGAGHLMTIAKLKTIAAVAGALAAAVALTATTGVLVVNHVRAQNAAAQTVPGTTESAPHVVLDTSVAVLPSETPPTIAAPDPHRLGGTVKLLGEPPIMPRIDMTGVPACTAHQTSPVYQETVVVGPDGGFANVVISIKRDEGMTLPETAAGTPPVLDQVGCQFTPHVIALRTGQRLLVKNGDPFLHNFHSQPENNDPDNRAMPNLDRNGTKSKIFQEPEYFRVKCDVHPWMIACVAVIDNPYFAVTDKNGNFTLPKGLPDGKYTLHAWHEKLGEQDLPITVTAGAAKADFTFRPQ